MSMVGTRSVKDSDAPSCERSQQAGEFDPNDVGQASIQSRYDILPCMTAASKMPR